MRKLFLAILSASSLALLSAMPVFAGEADVENVKVTQSANGTFRFNVTVRHGDEGWDHYSDGWEVLDESGKRLAFRKLLHPHENEQPFTRSISGVEIPAGVKTVVVRANDSVHSTGGKEMTVALPGR